MDIDANQMTSSDRFEATPEVAVAGGRIRGSIENNIFVFRGIPYGAPTGGPNRWLPPKKPVAWDGVRETTQFGPMCPQVFGAPLEEETAVLQRGPMSEDCLNLNLWTPSLESDEARRPVMVWFHGGAFSIGSGASATTDGTALARNHDVVVVTLNHRLNLFGFLDLRAVSPDDGACSANAGMLDCVAALEWVRDHIARFGGDPDNVTIFGHSGGGLKVMTLMAMPAAKGLFHRAIAQSGFALTANSSEVAADLARQALDPLGGSDLGPDQLREIPSETIVDVLAQSPGLIFALGPTVDGAILPRDPFAPSAPGLSSDVPLMLGSTETEITFLPFAPLEPIDAAELHGRLKAYTRLNDDDLDRLVGTYRAQYPEDDECRLFQIIASDWLLGSDAITSAERKAAQGRAPVFIYYFTKGSRARGGKLGSTHTIDVPYVFGTLERAPVIGVPTDVDQALAARLGSTWSSFARNGDPNNPAMPQWPPFDPATRSVMTIDDECIVVDNPRAAVLMLMAELKDKASQSLRELATGSQP